MSVHRCLGVLGGLGPLVTANFVERLYLVESKLVKKEQTMLDMVILSKPSFPDRSTLIMQNQLHVLKNHLSDSLNKIRLIGANEIIVLCFTLHAVFPLLEENDRTDLISLVDITLKKVLLLQKKSLLLCTTGARNAGIFINHRLWKDARQWVVMPDLGDQKAIHNTIYDMKSNNISLKPVHLIHRLAEKYQLDHFIFGCTEFHLMTDERDTINAALSSFTFIDALMLFQNELLNRHNRGLGRTF